MPNLLTCLWQKEKSNFRCPNLQSKTIAAFFSSAIANRSVVAISKSQRFRDAKAAKQLMYYVVWYFVFEFLFIPSIASDFEPLTSEWSHSEGENRPILSEFEQARDNMKSCCC